ncbi:MAG: hypothetical protein LQ337_002459 [Flavoplaca oasis]|nr:MAG: hypothetical protein LQ337_002459 [Flavoplaca oasis]
MKFQGLPFQASGPGFQKPGILAGVVIVFFVQCLHCLPQNAGIRFPTVSGSKSEPNNGSLGDFGDEFDGLDLRLHRRRIGANVFTVESIAIAFIHAMKESALEDYNGQLNRFDFLDILPPRDPVRITMVPAPMSFVAPLKRSKILWTLKTLAVSMMTMRIFCSLSFQVRYRTHDLYLGTVQSPTQRISISDLSPSHPLSPTATSVHNFNGSGLRDAASLQDEPHYRLNFHFVGEALPKIRIFESILTLLLRLAKDDHATNIPQIVMELPHIQARIFIKQVDHLPPAYRFQQYHAVALLEAVARYYVQHDRYTEMTFELITNGFLVAWGCVTRASSLRRWCGNMFPDGRVGVNGLVANI